MSEEAVQSPLSARRQLGFLGTFDKKFHKLRKELDSLKQKQRDPDAQGDPLAASEIERVARGLVGAGPVYGVDTISIWAKELIPRVERLKSKETAISEEDIQWLSSQFQLLERLHGEAVGRAKRALVSASDSSPASPPIPPVSDTNSREDPEPQNPLADKMGWALDPSPDIVPDRTPPPAGSRLGTQKVNVLVTALLAIDDRSLHKKVSFSLRNAGFQIQEAPDGGTVLQMAEEDSPDLVVVDLESENHGGEDLVRELSRNPLTDFIPVLKIVAEKSAADSQSIAKPIDTEKLVTTARKLSRHEPHSAKSENGIRDLNLQELTEFVFSEIHAGVLGAATGPHTSESFPILNQGPLVAAIWAVVARLRRVAAEGSQGKIRFLPTTHGPIGMMALDEAERVLDPTMGNVANETDIAALHGLSAIVIDDDHDIRAVFQKVLSVAGMNVIVASNGKEGLTAIEHAPPDIIITDILMPEMDGWELATRLKWDFALKHIPIIMLSWKEDFLQRVRELNVDANGYMLKEMDRKQILTRVAGVLKPRFSLEQRLSEEGEITGRVERIGVIGILQAAMTTRPNCRITIRENWNYFEVDILDGSLVSVNRTGTDGSFASGIPALERVLGVSSGRFSIVNRVEISKQQFQDGSMDMIRRACRRLNELNSHVVDGNLVNIRELLLNDDVIEIYCRVIPNKLKGPLDRLCDGESPRNIILSGSTSSETLETLLLDLIRMGAVKEIIDIEPVSTRQLKAEGYTTSALISAATREIIEIEQTIQDARQTSLTIQLSDEDLNEISNPTGTAPQSMFERQPNRLLANLHFWQLLSAICFAGFAIVTVLFLVVRGPSNREAEFSPETAIEPQREPSEPSNEPLPASEAVKLTGHVEEEAAPAMMAAKASTSKPSLAEAAVSETAIARDRTPPVRNATSKTVTAAVKTHPPKGSNRNSSAKAASIDPSDIDDEKGTGLLVIDVPEGVKPDRIRISVNGRLRGTVPIRLRLRPGIHEVVFSLAGNRAMKMVRVEAGQTKEIKAKIPE